MPTENRPALVLLHGMTGCGALWDPVTGLLEDRFAVTAPDLRGHGRAPHRESYELDEYADDIIALLEPMGSVFLAGHSLGGAVAWTVAARRPDLVRRLVIEDQHPLAVPDHWRGWQEWAEVWPRSFASRAEAEEFLQNAGRTVGWWAPSLVGRPDGSWGWAFDLKVPPLTARSLYREEQWAKLASLQMPTLLIRGELSPHLKSEVAARMQQTIPDCRLVTVPGADHWVSCHAETYAALLREFLAEA